MMTGYSVENKVAFRPNEVRYEGDIAYVIIVDSYGEKVCEAIIDSEDACRVVMFGRWVRLRRNHTTYAQCSWRCKKEQRGKNKSLHSLVYGEANGVIDHINGNGLDNRKSNLRDVSLAQNARNRRPSPQKASFNYDSCIW